LGVRPELQVAALFATGPAALFGLISGLLGGLVAGLAVFAVVGAALVAWPVLAADRLVEASLGGRDADASLDARLYNLVEGLATTLGVRSPRLVIVEGPGLNAMASGARRGRQLVAVTTTLLSELDLVELEAVLAEVLYRLRHSEVAAETVLVATFGLGRSMVLGADRDTRLDSAAVAVTRYPPALVSALEKMALKGSLVAGQTERFAHLWVADPQGAADKVRWRMSLADRCGALQEL
jgi:heat shock protein HtpX